MDIVDCSGLWLTFGGPSVVPPAPAQPPAGGGGRIREQPLTEIEPEKDWDEDEFIIFVH